MFFTDNQSLVDIINSQIPSHHGISEAITNNLSDITFRAKLISDHYNTITDKLVHLPMQQMLQAFPWLDREETTTLAASLQLCITAP